MYDPELPAGFQDADIELREMQDEAAAMSWCPACGDPIDYCSGHGEIGDPVGFAILQKHDAGQHGSCHPQGCDAA
jgi:hypothetical protein